MQTQFQIFLKEIFEQTKEIEPPIPVLDYLKSVGKTVLDVIFLCHVGEMFTVAKNILTCFNKPNEKMSTYSTQISDYFCESIEDFIALHGYAGYKNVTVELLCGGTAMQIRLTLTTLNGLCVVSEIYSSNTSAESFIRAMSERLYALCREENFKHEHKEKEYTLP